MGSGQSVVTCSFSVAASSGDTCQSLAATWGTSLSTFESLNPGIDCSNTLTTGQTYCVIGTVTTVTPSSTTSVTTATGATTTTPTTITITSTTSTTTASASPHQPTQSGIPSNCNKFYQVSSGDTCLTIEGQYGIDAAEFDAWNPSIDAQCGNLLPGYYVCVSVPGAVTTTPAPTPTNGPTPQMPGIVGDCVSFHLVESGDSCFVIDNAVGISLAQFLSWNSYIDANCDNMWLGYYVCVGV